MRRFGPISDLSTPSSVGRDGRRHISPDRPSDKAGDPTRMSSLSAALDFVPLNEEEEEHVLGSVGYTKSRLADDLALLRAWVAQQPHFPPSKLTENDNFFTNFLIGCKGSIERCKKKLDGYYSWRRRSVIFADRDPASQRTLDVCKSMTLALMPKCQPTGFTLHFVKLKTSETFDLMSTCRHMALLMDLRIRCIGISAGDTNVIDCADFSAAYLPSFNPTVLRDMISFIQDSLPQRCDQHYFINCSSLAQTVVNKMVKPFMKKKMRERITLSTEGNRFLLERFPKEILPCEYGGEGPSIECIQEKQIQALWELAKEGEGGLISRISELTDESRRPKDSPLTVDESLFGVQGTIKSLTID